MSNTPLIYHSEDNKSNLQASAYSDYSKMQQCAIRYLAYRDIPFLLNKYVHGKKALDNGVGTGSSTQFLQQQGFDVVGVDICNEMLDQAKLTCPNTPFYLIQNESLPFAANTYDLVFSGLVLFELGSEKEILKYLQESKRVMKNNGVLIALTGSQYVHSKSWLNLFVDYPENKNLKSGDLARCYIPDVDMEFTDYFWTEADYRRLFPEAGLQLVEIHYPLGKDDESYAWKDEKTCSPHVILVAKKLLI